MAGVYNGKVLMIGKNSCRALNLDTGKQLWSRETGVPCGQGVASNGIYYLPVINKDNDYMMDRAAQKAGRSYSGVSGIAAQDAAKTAGSSDGPWHLANTPALNIALSKAYFASLGLPELTAHG